MTLRQLSTLYLMAASGFVIAIGFSHHPDWRHNAETAASYVRLYGGETAVAVNDHVIRPSAAFVGRESAALYESVRKRWAPATPPKPIEQVASNAPPPTERYVPHLVRITPALRPAIVPESPAQVAGEAPQQEKQAKLTLAPEATAPREAAPVNPSTLSPPPSVAPASGEVARVEQRLRDSLTREMLENFGLFLYVSKAAAGPWAQHMYVFQKQANGDLALLHTWPVSTGREKVEFNAAGLKLPSFTPAGYFQLDPKRSTHTIVLSSGISRCPTPCSSTGWTAATRPASRSMAPRARTSVCSARGRVRAASAWRRRMRACCSR